MTKSRSDVVDVEIKRQWSIIPVRALLDRDLNQTELRVIAALCIFTNSYGVCWPGVETVGKVIGSDKATVSRVMARLVKKGYVRRLEPRDYQMEYAKFGKINRYQVLYLPDAPLPSWEEVQSSIALAPSPDAPDGQPKEMGSGVDDELNARARSLAHAYARAVERGLGQARNPDNEMPHARKLAAAGVEAAEVTAATAETCGEWLRRRAGVPSLADVALRIAGRT